MWGTLFDPFSKSSGALCYQSTKSHQAPPIPTTPLLKSNENEYFFIDQKTFEQISIKKDIVGEKGKFLKEDLNVSISFHNEIPLKIDLPNQISCKIESTDVALKGQTVSSSYKPATLDNGIKIQVPPFIESDDEIIVDTRTLEYVKKV